MVPSATVQTYDVAGCLALSQESARISCLENIVAQLTSQVQAVLGQQVGVGSTWCHTFNIDLGFANSGSSEVGHLHTALDKQGFSYAPDTGNTYSNGTALAVKRFQEKHASEILAPWGLTQGTGFVGTTTRAKLNQLYGCQPTPQQTRCNASGQCVIGGTGALCSSNVDCAPQTQASITVTSPNVSATWVKGGTYTVTWNSSGIIGYVSIGLRDDTRQSMGAVWSVNNVANTGYYSIILPATSIIVPGNKYKICVSHGAVFDCSDSYLNIIETTQTTEITATSCSETDNGLNYSTRGVTTGTNSWNGQYGSYIDSCSGSVLTEYHCANNLVSSSTYTCPYGCSNGVCQQSTNPNCVPNWQCAAWSVCVNNQQTRTCTDRNFCGITTGKPAESQSCVMTCSDTDNGLSYYTKGTTTGTGAWNRAYGSYVDSCSDNILTEYLCVNNWVSRVNYLCEYGCENGACWSMPAYFVRSPRIGDEWISGQEYTIEWETNPSIRQDWRSADIYLVKDSLKYTIEKNVPLVYVDHKLKWTAGIVKELCPDPPGVCGYVQPGYYQIRVCISGTSRCDSASVGILASPPPFALTIISPNGGEWLYNLYSHRISWRSEGVKYATIYLKKSSSIYGTIASDISGSGVHYNVNEEGESFYLWTIGPSIFLQPIPAGNDYKIEIVGSDHLRQQTVTDESDGYFRIQ